MHQALGSSADFVAAQITNKNKSEVVQKMILKSKMIPALCVALAMTYPALAQDIMPPEESVTAPKKEYSPYAGDNFPIRVLFGDTHLHSSWSADPPSNLGWAWLPLGTSGWAFESAEGSTPPRREVVYLSGPCGNQCDDWNQCTTDTCSGVCFPRPTSIRVPAMVRTML